MALKSNLLNMALALTLNCLLCSSILGGVYALTKESIEKAAVRKTEAAIAAVLPQFESSTKESVDVGGKTFNYFKAEGPEGTAGYAIESSVSGFGGPLTLLVGITPDGVVYNTSVLSHSETPGLGAKCTTDPQFTAQWKGFDPSVKILTVKKDGGDVDAITASTITSRAYAQAVSNAVAAFQVISGADTDAVTGSSVPAEASNNGGNEDE